MTREDLKQMPDPAADPEPLGVIGAPAADHAPAGERDAEAPEEDEDVEARLAYESPMRHRTQRRRKRLIAAGVAGGVLVAALLAWAASNMAVSQDIEAPSIQTIPVFREEFSESVQATGTARPISSVVVTPEIDGIITNVSVSLDDVVEEGQELFCVRNDDLDRAVREAELALRAQSLETDAAQDAYNELYYAAQETGDWAAADAQLVTLETARLQLEDAQAAYDQAVARAASRTVTAPAAGSVVVMNAVEGAAVGASGADGSGASGALVQIADLSQMTVSVQVNEVDISQIAVGQAARVSFSALPGVLLDGEVTRISTVASSGDGGYGYDYGVVTYDVEVLIPEPVAELKPGMTASVEIMLQCVPDALTVPASALMTDDGETYYVYVMTDEEAQDVARRDVTVTAQSATTAVVEGGVSEGDLVVLDPFAVEMDTDGAWDAGETDGELDAEAVDADDAEATDAAADLAR